MAHKNNKKDDPITSILNISISEGFKERLRTEFEHQPFKEHLSLSWFCRQLMTEAIEAREAKRSRKSKNSSK